jgi:hypothetical protein
MLSFTPKETYQHLCKDSIKGYRLYPEYNALMAWDSPQETETMTLGFELSCVHISGVDGAEKLSPTEIADAVRNFRRGLQGTAFENRDVALYPILYCN